MLAARVVFVLVSIAFLPPLAAQKRDRRDVVELTSGKSLKGRVVLETEDTIVLRIGSKERRLARTSIQRVQSVARAHREVHAAFRKAGDDPGAWLRLAKSCASRHLPHTARLLYWCVLLTDPQSEAAHEGLGHKKRRGRWLVPGRGGLMTLKRAAKVRSEWGKAWELRSEHYTVRCSAGLAACVHALFDLEFFYLTFFDLFQKRLGLREIVVPMKVNLYGNAREMPSFGSTVGAIFASDENIIYTQQADPLLRSGSLFHEATHSLLYNTTSGAAKSRGRLPAWLDEGWAVYMSGVLGPGTPGRPTFVPGGRTGYYFHAVRDAKKPYKLHRLLNFQADDFAASSHQRIKYGQSYVLVHYLLHGASEEQRETFWLFLRQAIAGKGQASTFRRLFRSGAKRLEKGYLAWAASGSR